MNNPKLPTIKDLASLVRALKPQIDDDYRASEFDDEDGQPSMCLTIGADGKGSGNWSYQTGDNSYSGGAYGYPFWAVVTLTRRCNSREVAKEAIDQLADGLTWNE